MLDLRFSLLASECCDRSEQSNRSDFLTKISDQHSTVVASSRLKMLYTAKIAPSKRIGISLFLGLPRIDGKDGIRGVASRSFRICEFNVLDRSALGTVKYDSMYRKRHSTILLLDDTTRTQQLTMVHNHNSGASSESTNQDTTEEPRRVYLAAHSVLSPATEKNKRKISHTA